MEESYRGDKEASPIPDPGLIFRAGLGAGVHDGALRRSLAGAKIKAMAPAPAKDGYRAALTGDHGLARPRQRLGQCRASA